MEILERVWAYLPEFTDEEDWQPSREEFVEAIHKIAIGADRSLTESALAWARSKQQED